VTRVLHILPHPGGGAETYIDTLEALEGFEHERIPLSMQREPVKSLPSLARRRRSISAAVRDAELVHVHGDTSAILVPRPRGTPVVWTTHGLHLMRRTSGPAQSLVLRGIRRAVRLSARTICSSQLEHDELVDLLGPREADQRLETLVAGVPDQPGGDSRDAVRADLGVGAGTTVALFAAELEPRKDPLGAIQATHKAREAGADLVLLMAGEGSLLPEVRAEAGDGVQVLGFRRDLDRLMAAADLFVLPSTREGLSLALLEAMARSLVPVVASGAGNPEAVGDAGIVVQPGDAAALAAALGRLAAAPEERARLGAAARERQQREFGVDRFLRGIADVYERALR
jgi:glycosyltransferase involved in cell wall biosynthesis